jgi:hypothetical protein
MATHWNIQLNVQRVEESDETRVAVSLSGKAPIKKTSLEVLSLKVSADTEAEAYLKLTRVLTATHPDVVVVPAGETMTLSEALSSPNYPTEGSFANPRPIRDNPKA